MKTTNIVGIGIAVILAIGIITVVGIQTSKSAAQSSTLSGGFSVVSTLGAVSSASATASGTSSTTDAASSMSTESTTSTSSSQQSSSTGDFAVMATDPPVVASGVTAAAATYDSLAVHSAGDSNSTGWVDLNGTGTVNLMSSANVSQTVAASQIESGTYDMVRIGIQSASVTYQGQVYAATVASSNITSRLQSDVQVTGSQSAAAVVDLRTFIINAANSTNPQFLFSATAKSTTVPPSEFTSASLQIGAQTAMQGTWWVGFNDQTSTNLTIASATLTSDSLGVVVNNSGNDTADIQTIIITPVSSSTSTGADTLPASFSGSAVFTVSGAGTVQSSNSLQAAALLGGIGAQCSAGSSTTLSFSGSITLGFGVVGLQLSGLLPGQQYVVTVMGAHTYASALVTAQ